MSEVGDRQRAATVDPELASIPMNISRITTRSGRSYDSGTPTPRYGWRHENIALRHLLSFTYNSAPDVYERIVVWRNPCNQHFVLHAPYLTPRGPREVERCSDLWQCRERGGRRRALLRSSGCRVCSDREPPTKSGGAAWRSLPPRRPNRRDAAVVAPRACGAG